MAYMQFTLLVENTKLFSNQTVSETAIESFLIHPNFQ